MIKVISGILALIICVPQAYAAIEPKCHKQCLEDGYYSVTCDSICNADEKIGIPFNVAARQYKCLKPCEQNNRGRTLLECVLDCRQSVRDAILTEKKNRFMKSITEAEEIIDKNHEEIEKKIDESVTSKKINVEKPPPLVIE